MADSTPDALLRLNSHATGYVGLATGGVAILAAIGAFFKLLSTPAYLVALWIAYDHARAGQMTDTDNLTVATLVGACFAICGALVAGLVAAYLGRPKTVPEPPGH